MDFGRTLDRVVGLFNPRAEFARMQARAAIEVARAHDLKKRHYEGAAVSRRTAGWKAPATSADQALLGQLGRLRDRSRDLCRNNPYAIQAIENWESEIVGTGIIPVFEHEKDSVSRRLAERWAEHCETTAIDADGRHNVYGQQGLALRTIFESGESLVRRRRRRAADKLALPFQVEILEPDHLDPTKETVILDGGRYIRHGIQFDALGRREGYWLLPEHPGEPILSTREAQLVPASEVQHVYKCKRPKQKRGTPALAPVLIKLRDLDEFEDAQLLKQKISACLTAFLVDQADTEPPPTTGANQKKDVSELDTIEPGAILRAPAGKTVEFSEPPTVGEYEAYIRSVLRATAAGVQTTYEALSGDWSKVNYSSARMGWLQNSRIVDRFRWNVLVPQYLNPLALWFLDACILNGDLGVNDRVRVTWTPPRRAMLDPEHEIPARRDAVRAGFVSPSELLREDGYEPEAVWSQAAADFKKMRALGLRFECDPEVPLQGAAVAQKKDPQPAE